MSANKRETEPNPALKILRDRVFKRPEKTS